MKSFQELQEYLTERQKSPEYDKLAKQIDVLRKEMKAKLKEAGKLEDRIRKEQQNEKAKYGEVKKGTLMIHTKEMQDSYKERTAIGDKIEALQAKLYV